MSTCKIRDGAGLSKDVALINSGESILIFDFTETMSAGTSGLIKTLHLHDILPKLSAL